MMHLEPVHITWITIFVIYFSFRAFETYMWCKYPSHIKKSFPLFTFKYSKPTKSDEKTSSR